MPTAHLVHGFNVSDGGRGTVGRLIPHLQNRGFETILHSEKWHWGIIRDLFSVRFGNAKRAKTLAQFVNPGDYLIGHSNGCAVINEALWALAQMSPGNRVRAIFVNPALDSDTPISPVIERLLVYSTPTDRVVQLSKILRQHQWGDMGRVGYRGPYGSRVQNVRLENLGIMDAGHSGAFAQFDGPAKMMVAFDDWLEEIDD